MKHSYHLSLTGAGSDYIAPQRFDFITMTTYVKLEVLDVIVKYSVYFSFAIIKKTEFGNIKKTITACVTDGRPN